MRKAVKNKGKIVKAYRLGDKNEVIDELIAQGKIKTADGERFEIFSQEAVNGTGEEAYAGDYVKVDSTGAPYPNKAEFFQKKHRHISGDDYEQIPTPLNIWSVEDGMCEEIEFLMKEKGLVIDEANEKKYFSAPLWGCVLSAAKNAVIVFYGVTEDSNGNIEDIDFNFVEREEFEKTYDLLE